MAGVADEEGEGLAEGGADGLTDGEAEGLTDGETDGLTEGLTDGLTEGGVGRREGAGPAGGGVVVAVTAGTEGGS